MSLRWSATYLNLLNISLILNQCYTCGGYYYEIQSELECHIYIWLYHHWSNSSTCWPLKTFHFLSEDFLAIGALIFCLYKGWAVSAQEFKPQGVAHNPRQMRINLTIFLPLSLMLRHNLPQHFISFITWGYCWKSGLIQWIWGGAWADGNDPFGLEVYAIPQHSPTELSYMCP